MLGSFEMAIPCGWYVRCHGYPNSQGPNNTDDFIPITIRNVQRKRVNVPFVTAGQSASFALKKARRQDIRKGMVMLQKTDLQPQAVREFIAEGNNGLQSCSNS
jgi:GTPase